MPVSEPMSVMAEVITSLPRGSWSDATAMWTADVPLEQAMQCLTPYISANRFSKARTLAPTNIILVVRRQIAPDQNRSQLSPFLVLSLQFFQNIAICRSRQNPDNVLCNNLRLQDQRRARNQRRRFQRAR